MSGKNESSNEENAVKSLPPKINLAVKKIILISVLVTGCSGADAQTLAQKNNNPVNLKAFVQWDGMTGKDKYGHAVFESMDYGIRAALKNAQTRRSRRPCQTLREWMNDFAEENGDFEAEYIARKMNIPSETLLKNIDMAELVRHQAWFEGQVEISRNKITEVRERFGI